MLAARPVSARARAGVWKDADVTQPRRTIHGKLVRDRIPEIIAGNGEVPRVRVLSADRLFPALVAKLHEETDELASAGPGDILGELADVHEVFVTITTLLGYTVDQVEQASARKRSARGAFSEGYWLDEVEHP